MPASSPEELSITVDGRTLSGWKSIRVSRGIERFPSDFEVSITEKYPGATDIIVRPGDPVEVRLGSDLVLTGYIDRFSDAITPDNHTISISGRGKCQDLLDASAEIAQWHGQRMSANIGQLAEELAAPYSIGVDNQSGNNPVFETFSANLGESGYDILERVARSLRLLVYEDVQGRLVLGRVAEDALIGDAPIPPGATHVGNFRVGLDLGLNVQRAAAQWSIDQCFSEYVIVPHTVDTQGDQRAAMNAPPNFEVGRSLDRNVRRNRRLYMIGEQFQRGQSLAQSRADWERNRRWGRAQVVRVTTDGWRDANNQLWEPNTLVLMDLPNLYLPNKIWLLADVTYNRTAGTGTTAELILMPREAFEVQPATLSAWDWDRQQAVQTGGGTPTPTSGAGGVQGPGQ